MIKKLSIKFALSKLNDRINDEQKQKLLDFLQNHENLVKVGLSVDKAYSKYKEIKGKK